MLGLGKCPPRVEFEEPAVPTLRGPVNRWVTSLEQLLNVGVITCSLGTIGYDGCGTLQVTIERYNTAFSGIHALLCTYAVPEPTPVS